MFVVTVTIQVKAEKMSDFLPLLLANAKATLETENDCVRFDVLSDLDRPYEVFLYEIYTDTAAFDMHLKTSHFKDFSVAIGPMVTSRTLKTYRGILT